MTSLIPVLDCHNDLPFALREKAGYDVQRLNQVREELHTDLVRMRRGGVGAQFWSAWVPSSIPQEDAVVATLQQIDAIHRLTAAFPETLQPARTADDVESALATGRIASLIGLEGGQSIADSLAVLRQMFHLGARSMTLTHNDDLAWATAATGAAEAQAEADGTAGSPGARSTCGLTGEGLAVVAEMNRLGMLVDLSHTNERTQLDALGASTVPTLFTHSSVQSVNPHPRNVTDRVLERIAATDSVLGLTFVPAFVSSDVRQWILDRSQARIDLGIDDPNRSNSLTRPYSMPAAPRPGQSCEDARAHNTAHHAGFDYGDTDAEVPPAAAARLADWEVAHPEPRATLDGVVAHLEAAREAVGITRIALGGDYDGAATLPAGLEDVSRYQDLLHALADRGWSRGDLEALAFRNVLRVMRAAEDGADEPAEAAPQV
ncbi:membrane dipeptidase [Brevibacterium jeotgali]|uniref:Membrane dipeptidase n=2 Tax=Brevibacterium jeotgali TaxID=1262550 RepID=A0A2H1L727_9MICO|nr:membrane dipeptidase [Brevibacterium jeotgali]SMY12679.1 membrane dipeptidase [Brevibacterium jeotgali]